MEQAPSRAFTTHTQGGESAVSKGHTIMAEPGVRSLDESLRKKRDACVSILRELGSVVVAFSGGTDSSLLLALAVEALGRENVLAAMAVSTIFPQSERRAGVEFARRLGAKLLQLETPHLADPKFTANPADRCYYCKTRLLKRLLELAEKRNLKAVVTGSNISDTGDYRPGLQAEKEHHIRQPLLEAKLSKDEIRRISKAMGLPGWDHPSKACLASRIPYGQEINEETLSRIEKSEEFLGSLGFRQYRVRDHGQTARIELLPEDLSAAVERREEIVTALKGVGYAYVTLDLQGFRTGSMNETLPK